ncbi:hypothetical protein PENSPDRAFT_248331 [Peniophora sp. CONT]|nr:hypothetical protein PENSPDRAFT_248331 [Peniophora sp. CONT]
MDGWGNKGSKQRSFFFAVFKGVYIFCSRCIWISKDSKGHGSQTWNESKPVTVSTQFHGSTADEGPGKSFV